MTTAQPRFQVSLDATRAPVVSSVAATQLPSAPSRLRPERFPLQIKRGSVTVKIYGPKPGPFTIAWHDGATGGRKRAMRSGLETARSFAEEKATELANGETWRSQFGQADYASYLRCLQLAQETGAPLEVLVAEAAEARRKRNSQHATRNTPEVVAELLEVKRREGKCGDKWLRALERMLNSLAAYWPGPLHLIRAHDLNAWLRGIKGGLIYRHHHYAAALQLIHFATGTNCVRAADFGDDFWKLVDDPEPPPVRIKIWTPEQLLKLLAKTLPNMIPFTALQAFAGVRHEELVPADFSSGTKAARTKIPLDWRDIYFGDGGQCGPHIEITEDTGKTGARIIPMSDNLVAWLTPHRKTSGPVCTVRNTANALTKAKRRAGLPAGKNESRNVLRKSFGSYRLAVVKHIGQVADEMGNSPAKIKSNYRKPRSESEGKRWFDIWPTTAEVLQLNFGGM